MTSDMMSENAQHEPARREGQTTSSRLQRRAAQTAVVMRRAWPYALTSIITLGLILVYRLLNPPAPPLTPQEVEAISGELVAEITPAPAYSASVYEAILPSMVVIKSGSATLPGDRSAMERDDSLLPIAHRSDSGRAGWSGPEIQGSTRTVQSAQSQGFGAGVVVSADGAILTAYHVIERTSMIEVIFADGTETTATIAAIEPDNNIAVLLPDRLPEVFAPAVLGSPGALRVGDEAYVVGNPFGLAGSMSAGVISGFDRSYRLSSDAPPLQRLIQFDAAVNPGNAGGPLLNRNGEVVGIIVGPANPGSDNTFIGIGFAVRIDVAGAAAGAPPQ